MAQSDDHYLKRELYERVRNDPSIFEFLQEGSLDGIWYWDVEEPENEWLSPRFKSLFGYAEDEIPHTSAWWQENIFPEDLHIAIENFQKHCDDPTHPYDQVVRYRHKDGSTVWVRCRGLAVRDEQGKPVRMLGAHTDVTEAMVARRELERNVEELGRCNAELQQFAYVASHDLREPLRMIASYSELLARRYEGELDARADKYIRYVREGADRMQLLLSDLLTYSRVGAKPRPFASTDTYADAPRPDLVLLDLNLPRKDGREVLTEVKADCSLKRIPVIVLTSSEAETDVLKTYDLNANCYIRKPVDLDGFKTIVETIEAFWFSLVVLPPKNGNGRGSPTL